MTTEPSSGSSDAAPPEPSEPQSSSSKFSSPLLRQLEAEQGAVDDGAEPALAQRGGLFAFLQLVRLPTVFTCVSDIFMAFLLTHGSFQPMRGFLLLLGASVCHYWTGMILNDWYDRAVDATERPTRPIPSGRIKPQTALFLAVTFNLVGLGLAALVSQQSLLVAGLLTTAIWLYDGRLKATRLAPVVMGSCRSFNVLLGASLTPDGGQLWCPYNLHVAGALGLYICGVTLFARTEAKQSAQTKLIFATFVINLGLAALAGFVMQTPDADRRATPVAMLVVITLTILRRLVPAILEPKPRHVQLGVKMLLLSYVMLNATLVHAVTGNTNYATCVVALLLPAVVLAKRIPMT